MITGTYPEPTNNNTIFHSQQHHRQHKKCARSRRCLPHPVQGLLGADRCRGCHFRCPLPSSTSPTTTKVSAEPFDDNSPTNQKEVDHQHQETTRCIRPARSSSRSIPIQMVSSSTSLQRFVDDEEHHAEVEARNYNMFVRLYNGHLEQQQQQRTQTTTDSSAMVDDYTRCWNRLNQKRDRHLLFHAKEEESLLVGRMMGGDVGETLGSLAATTTKNYGANGSEEDQGKVIDDDEPDIFQLDL